jgi:hypothetical protein
MFVFCLAQLGESHTISSTCSVSAHIGIVRVLAGGCGQEELRQGRIFRCRPIRLGKENRRRSSDKDQRSPLRFCTSTSEEPLA